MLTLPLENPTPLSYNIKEGVVMKGGNVCEGKGKDRRDREGDGG